MLMNKFTAFEDAAMLNMHGLSNAARAAVGKRVWGGGCGGAGEEEEGERIKTGEWKGK